MPPRPLPRRNLLHRPTLQHYRHALDESARDERAAFLKDSADRRTRHAEVLGDLLLAQALKIRQAYRLVAIKRQNNRLNLRGPHAGGLEQPRSGLAGYFSVFRRS